MGIVSGVEAGLQQEARVGSSDKYAWLVGTGHGYIRVSSTSSSA